MESAVAVDNGIGTHNRVGSVSLASEAACCARRCCRYRVRSDSSPVGGSCFDPAGADGFRSSGCLLLVFSVPDTRRAPRLLWGAR